MSTTWTCPEGHRYVAPSARLGEQAPCPVCHPYGFRVNHNGTEDWIDLDEWVAPAVAARLHYDGDVPVFGTFADAEAFARDICRDTLRWRMLDCGEDRATACGFLGGFAEGIPVQVIDHGSGEVVAEIAPALVPVEVTR